MQHESCPARRGVDRTEALRLRRAEIGVRLDELRQQLQEFGDASVGLSCGRAEASAARLPRAREHELAALLRAADAYDRAADAHDHAARVLERAGAATRACAHREASAHDRSMAVSQRRIAAVTVVE
jgi:cell division septum initiation protein DivIVA